MEWTEIPIIPHWIYVISFFFTLQRSSTQISLTEELGHLDTRRIMSSFDRWRNRLREAQKFAYGPSFPFLLLGLCVCVRVCFRKSCFVLPAALAWFRFAGPSLPPSLPPSLLFSLPPSRPPLSGGRGPGVPGMSLVPPLSAHPAPSPRRPPARPRLRGMSPKKTKTQVWTTKHSI